MSTPDSASITNVNLIRLSAVTHSSNMEQRINRLNFTQAVGGLNITAPADNNLVPPGYYMLFILNGIGVPSVASIIRVTGSVPGANPSISLSKTSLAFGTKQLIGTSSSAMPVVVTNLGSSSVTINSIAVQGADFLISSNACGNNLAGASSCTVSVQSHPTVAGPLSGTLVINDSDVSSPQTVSLSGTGTALKLSRNTFSFGSTIIGTTSSQNVGLTLTNLDTSPITLNGLTYSNTQFSQYAPSSTCGTTLTGGTNCVVATAFTPTAVGNQAGTLTIVDSDPSGSSVVTFTGVGTSVSLTPVVLAFASTPTNTTSQAPPIILNNVGAVAVNISSITLGGANPGDFAIASNTCGSQVAPAGNCAINLTFTPLAVGGRSATLMASDDGGASPQTAKLTGTGLHTLTALTVTPANPSILAGSTQQFTATGIYSDGYTAPLTTSASWYSLNTKVATLSTTTKGLFNAVAFGSAIIKAVFNNISNTTTLTVQSSTTTAVSSSNSTSIFGQSVTFSVTVSPGTATGTVQLFDGVSSIGTSALSAGTASLTTSTLNAGSHSITATYTGDTYDSASTSSALTQTVNPVSTKTAISSDTNPSVSGQTVTFTATLSPGTATGLVQFFDASTLLGTVPLSGGTASFSIANLASGSHSITASYGGDANNISSTSPVITQVVN